MYPQRSVMTCGLATALEPPHFNHAPAWGATISAALSLRPLKMFQSTHPRGVRQLVFLHLPTPEPVSIHAPAWGATACTRGLSPRYNPFQSTHPRGVRHDDSLFSLVYTIDVSIHAPAWGATLLPLENKRTVRSFNPRTRVGCDHSERSRGYPRLVSFNPRTRVGCDSLYLSWTLRSSCFNPRTRVGCDFDFLAHMLSIILFQSTHPRGVRPRYAL